jgi:hypothetical protein
MQPIGFAFVSKEEEERRRNAADAGDLRFPVG